MSAFLDFSMMSKSFPTASGHYTVLRDFDLKIQEGEFVCLIGHSGCGKSTVLSIAAGLAEATSGGAIMGGKELRGPGTDRGVVFQSPCLLPWMSALENVLLAVEQAQRRLPAEERRKAARHYLELVGLADALESRPGELSQGMRQLVGIARAFALSPQLLLLDEPFGMLDSITKCELQSVLAEIWRRERMTALMVTHDVDEALFLADRIVMMTNGPEARVGRILQVPFSRPRQRDELLESAEYYRLREEMIDFLENLADRTTDDSPKKPRVHDRIEELAKDSCLPSASARV